LNQAPVGGGPSADVLSKPTIGWAVWSAPQGIGRGGQRPSIGGTGQPNKPINANWQARFLLSLLGLRSSQTHNLPLLTLSIALLAGR